MQENNGCVLFPSAFGLQPSSALSRWSRLSLGTIETNAFQSEEHFLQRLFAKVRNALQIFSGAIEEITYGEDSSFLEAVGGAHRQADFGRAHLQPFFRLASFFFPHAEWNASARH